MVKVATEASNVKNMLTKKSERKIKHLKSLSRQEEENVIKLYNELVPGDDRRTIDIEMIVTEAFSKFEETIGETSFSKVKKYFGIDCKSRAKNIKKVEIKSLIAKLRTIENAQYYITGYKEMIKKMADKLLNAPEGMTDLEKAKVIRMFFIIFNENEIFLEDYIPRMMLNGEYQVSFSEERALSNNKKNVGPEELLDIFSIKVEQSSGYFYDMMVLQFKRMYQLFKSKYKRELEEVMEFAELKYDSKAEKFTSVNKCMNDVTFGEIRNLKKRIFQVRSVWPLEIFCNKRMIEENIDITNLYVIYKTFKVYPWKEKSETKYITYKTLTGSRFIEKQQLYYEVFDNFLIADDAEAEYWISLLEYIAENEIVLKTQFDGNGGVLAETEYYNVGVLFSTFKYAIEVGYLSEYTKVIKDFEVAKKLFALDGAEEKFLRLKRGEVKVEDMKELLGIDEDFENKVLQINKQDNANEQDTEKNLVQSVIKFAMGNGYIKSEEDVDISLIENVFIPGNEEIITKFSNGKMDDFKFRKKIGFEEEFAEAYFNTSKINIKEVEAKLQEIKKYGKKEQICQCKLLVSLYCYVVNNNVGCGPKNKPAKRNKGLKPEILESLIA